MKVSVITPSYYPTKEKYERSYKSILDQDTNDLEWIIVSDGDGGQFKDSLGDGYEYDAVLYRNYGPSVAMNAGFQLSSGDIIAYLGMGDIWYPDRARYLIDKYSSNPYLEILFDGHILQYPDGTEQIHNLKIHEERRGKVGVIQALQSQNIAIPHSTSHTRKPFVEVGGYQRGIVCGEDGILWRRMVDRLNWENIEFTDKMAGVYYVESDSQAREQRRFEMGGFAFDGSRHDNGKYLDKNWFETYNSAGLYD